MLLPDTKLVGELSSKDAGVTSAFFVKAWKVLQQPEVRQQPVAASRLSWGDRNALWLFKNTLLLSLYCAKKSSGEDEGSHLLWTPLS